MYITHALFVSSTLLLDAGDVIQTFAFLIVMVRFMFLLVRYIYKILASDRWDDWQLAKSISFYRKLGLIG